MRIPSLPVVLIAFAMGPVLRQTMAQTGEDSQPARPMLRDLGSGVFEIGKVRLNKRDRTVRIPVTVNMSTGVVEYLLVTTNGKTHESILSTDAEPYHVQLAMLLLGAKGRGTNSFPPTTELPPPGDAVRIELVSANAARSPTKRAEQLVFDKAAKRPMKKLDWVYNGSFIDADGFAAQQTGSIISLIDDPEALVNNPLPKRDDDENWLVNERVVKGIQIPAELKLTLLHAVDQH